MSRPDHRSAAAQEYRRFYNTTRWRRLRLAHLRAEPLCRMCLVRGITNDGSLHNDGSAQENSRRRSLVCDHVDRHGGDEVKFFTGPFQTLCADDHDIVKQQIENRGFVAGSDLAGRPIDPSHPWNRRARA